MLLCQTDWSRKKVACRQVSLIGQFVEQFCIGRLVITP